jgi:small-conductance mechanosensitive channel
MSLIPRMLVGLAILWCLAVSCGSSAWAEKPQAQQPPAAGVSLPKDVSQGIQNEAGVTLPKDVSQGIKKEATKMKAHFAAKARTVFRREPLGFTVQTLERVRQGLTDLPSQVLTQLRNLSEELRLLGLVGSLVLFAFLAVAFYSLFGWQKVFGYLHKIAEPLEALITERYAPYLHMGLRVLAAALIPLILYGLFVLVTEFIHFEAPWFLLLGKLLRLWALGAFIIRALREILLSGLLPVPTVSAARVYRVSRWVILYVLLSIALLDGAKLFQVQPDVLALLRFLISISVVLASLFLFVKKNAILGLLPELPYRTYQVIVNGLRRFYYPALFLTFLTAIAWCFGYRNFAYFVWIKTWAVVGIFLGIMFLFHAIRVVLQKWIQEKDPTNYEAVLVHRSLYHLLIFITISATIIIILQFLEILDPLVSFISFPLVIIGAQSISLWTFIKIILLFIGVVYTSRLFRSYLDYKVFPMMGIDEGMAYSINTLISYLFFTIGIFITLSVVGIDIRTVMVFAGAIGIGIGLGLQKIASNFISGVIIIFGRKVRKGDWVQIGDALGLVQRVTLASTIVWTRDNIQYIIPNTDIIANTVTNYTFSDPEIRIHIPVGVSYNADPLEVRRILLEAAERNEHVKKTKKPRVWFTEYGDSSINFALLVWIDIRRVSRSYIKSLLYFDIFQALRQAGIEIPFPQRDLHLKSGFSPTEKES